MKILTKISKKEFVKLIPETLDDLFLIEEFLEKGDLVKGVTYRKINLSDEGDKTKIVKKKFIVTLNLDKTDLQEDTLKILGSIIDAPQFVPKGAIQSINASFGEQISILKQNWPKFWIKQLKDSTKQKQKLLVVTFDKEDATFASVEGNHKKILLKLNSGTSNTQYVKDSKKDHFKNIANLVKEFGDKEKPKIIVLASPHLWKETIKPLISQEILSKITFATTSTGQEPGINEVLKRDELQKALINLNYAREQRCFDRLTMKISKNEAVYSVNDVKNSINVGAVKEVLVSKTKVTNRNILDLLKNAENMGAKIKFISTKEIVKRLDSLGGIAALLRFKIS